MGAKLPKKLKNVKQRNDTDCGIACVAILTGKSYEDAKRLVFPEATTRKKRFLTNTRRLITALRKDGYETGDRLIPLRGKEPQHTGILKTKSKRVNWHWMVYDARNHALLDPKPYKINLEKVSLLPVWGAKKGQRN